jgi:hypothetical protein
MNSMKNVAVTLVRNFENIRNIGGAQRLQSIQTKRAQTSLSHIPNACLQLLYNVVYRGREIRHFGGKLSLRPNDPVGFTIGD